MTSASDARSQRTQGRGSRTSYRAVQAAGRRRQQLHHGTAPQGSGVDVGAHQIVLRARGVHRSDWLRDHRRPHPGDARRHVPLRDVSLDPVDRVGLRGATQDRAALVQGAWLRRIFAVGHAQRTSRREVRSRHSAAGAVRAAAIEGDAMSTITISFTPWRKFHAFKDKAVIRRWLKTVADASEKAFKNMKGYPPASSPGEYPAIRTGNLRGSISTVVTDDSMTIGSNMYYSWFLRKGTTRMARRKMSDNALQEGMNASSLGRWVRWVHS